MIYISSATQHAFLQAVRYGEMEEIRRLQPTFNHAATIIKAIDLAILYDQRECLTFLLSVAADVQNLTTVNYPVVLHSAVISGRDGCVEIVLPYVSDDDVKFELTKLMRAQKMVGFDAMYARISHDQPARQQVFLEAVLNNYHSCVKLLLPTVDPKFNDSVALQVACLRRHTDVIDLLYPVSDADLVLAVLKDQSYDCSILEDKVQQERLHATLCDVTGCYGVDPLGRKM